MGVGRAFTVVVMIPIVMVMMGMLVIMVVGMIRVMMVVVMSMAVLMVVVVMVMVTHLLALDPGLTLATAAYGTHQSTSSSLIRSSSPPVICNW